MEELPSTAPTQTQSLLPVIGGIAILALIAGGLFWSMRTSTPTDTIVTQQQPTSPTDTIATEQVAGTVDQAATTTTVELEAGSFYYKPNEIRVKKGEKVKIVMHSVSMMHDFVIDELGVKLPVVKNGETGTIEFTPEEAGTFEYYCSVGQHRAQGQVGTLIVE